MDTKEHSVTCAVLSGSRATLVAGKLHALTTIGRSSSVGLPSIMASTSVIRHCAKYMMEAVPVPVYACPACVAAWLCESPHPWAQ